MKQHFMPAHPTRRAFLKTTGTSLAGLASLNVSPALAQSSLNERIRHAVIGIGSKGKGHCKSFSQISGCEVVAVCDVDPERLNQAAALLPRMNTKRMAWFKSTLGWIGLVSALVTLNPLHAAGGEFAFTQTSDRLAIAFADKPVAEFVFRDEKILRPYFANVHTPEGRKVTRNHPPLVGLDANDHATMHPGIWLAFGDISGQDFWRNKARIEHVRFIEPPTVRKHRLTFATENVLRTTNGELLCSLTNHFDLIALTNAWLLIWDATFFSADNDIAFGDQEEMGFGLRVATAITEKTGGLISSSSGQKTAKNTWGQPGEWCDYSGTVEGQELGITAMVSPANFRPSWWHNRNYGLMVANPFGRDAMKQGAKSSVLVKRGATFRLCFGAAIHQGRVENLGAFYDTFRAHIPGLQTH